MAVTDQNLGVYLPLSRSQLFSIDIKGSGDSYTLVVNKHRQVIKRAPLSYCIEKRNEILSRRNYAVPEDWDLEWNVKEGCVWHPGLDDDDNQILWITMGDAYITKSGSDVILIEDRSSYTHRFGSVGYDPSIAVGINGQNVLQFNGTSEYLESEEDVDDLFDMGTGSFSFAAFVDWGADTDDSRSFFSNGSATTGFTMIKKMVSSQQRLGFMIDGSNVVSSGTDSETESENMVVGIRTSGVGAQSWGNGVAGTLNTSAGIIAEDIANSHPLQLGRKSSGSAPWWFDGGIYEIIFWNRAITTAERQRVEGYFAHKYTRTAALASDHPYKVHPPKIQVQGTVT